MALEETALPERIRRTWAELLQALRMQRLAAD
jgi:hypothetical protein